MTCTDGIIDVGGLDAVENELDQFFGDTEWGGALPFPLHGTGEEQSLHGAIMHAMEHPPMNADTPLTSIIYSHEYHR